MTFTIWLRKEGTGRSTIDQFFDDCNIHDTVYDDK